MKKILATATVLYFAMHIIPVVSQVQVPEDEVLITASSTLPPSSTSDYSPENLMDGTGRSWSEGAEGNGVGESFKLEFMYPDHMRYITISNGYGVEKYYSSNARIRELEITDERGTRRVLRLEDTPVLRSYGLTEISEDDGGRLYDDEGLHGKAFDFEILDVYEGDRWADACISEIFINSWYSVDFVMDEQFIARNVLREYFDGYFDRHGDLYLDNGLTGLIKADIESGLLTRNILSGDGTTGYMHHQVIVHGLTGDIYLLIAGKVSELSQEAMEGKMGVDGKPERITSYKHEFLIYDPGTSEFSESTGLIWENLFDSDPSDILSERAAAELSEQQLILKFTEPQVLSISLAEHEKDPAFQLDYLWDGNWFRLK